MLQSTTLSFLSDLKKNNNKPWFDTNRKRYESAKADFIILVDELIQEISRFDPSIVHLQAKECVFRINRDVRFSKNKDPYKTNMGASITSGGRKVNQPGYYIHCEPGGCFAAGGFYMPEPADLSKIRQEIDYSWAEFYKLIQHREFKKYFPEGVNSWETLTRPPKGYEAENPAIHYLKMKGFIVSSPLADDSLLKKQTVRDLGKIYAAMKPLLDFLQTAIS